MVILLQVEELKVTCSLFYSWSCCVAHILQYVIHGSWMDFAFLMHSQKICHMWQEKSDWEPILLHFSSDIICFQTKSTGKVTDIHLSPPACLLMPRAVSKNKSSATSKKKRIWIQYLGEESTAFATICVLLERERRRYRGRGNEGSRGWIRQRDILVNYFPNAAILEATSSQSNLVCRGGKKCFLWFPSK